MQHVIASEFDHEFTYDVFVRIDVGDEGSEKKLEKLREVDAVIEAAREFERSDRQRIAPGRSQPRKISITQVSALATEDPTLAGYRMLVRVAV